jgi:hypothetical protein
LFHSVNPASLTSHHGGIAICHSGIIRMRTKELWWPVCDGGVIAVSAVCMCTQTDCPRVNSDRQTILFDLWIWTGAMTIVAFSSITSCSMTTDFTQHLIVEGSIDRGFWATIIDRFVEQSKRWNFETIDFGCQASCSSAFRTLGFSEKSGSCVNGRAIVSFL